MVSWTEWRSRLRELSLKISFGSRSINEGRIGQRGLQTQSWEKVFGASWPVALTGSGIGVYVTPETSCGRCLWTSDLDPY